MTYVLQRFYGVDQLRVGLPSHRTSKPEHLLLHAQRFLASDLLALAEECALLDSSPLIDGLSHRNAPIAIKWQGHVLFWGIFLIPGWNGKRRGCQGLALRGRCMLFWVEGHIPHSFIEDAK